MKFIINGDPVEIGGASLPPGGTTGQALVKASDEDGDVKWADKQDKLTGAAGQVVGFDANGEAVAQDAPAGVPTGFIGLWSGEANAIPSGWALCDGTNGTPDLRDRFVLGAGNKYAVGDTGGSEAVTLTVDQMPEHIHKYIQLDTSIVSEGIDDRLFQGYISDCDGPPTLTSNYRNVLHSDTGYIGGNQPHPNMPPYYALCYIMKE